MMIRHALIADIKVMCCLHGGNETAQWVCFTEFWQLGLSWLQCGSCTKCIQRDTRCGFSGDSALGCGCMG